MEVDVAEAEMTRTRADSSTFWPWATHSLATDKEGGVKVSNNEEDGKEERRRLTGVDGRTDESCYLAARTLVC